MTAFRDTHVSATLYNKLPHVSHVASVPDDHAADLTDLRALLAKYHVPDGVSIRLIHKHFDLKDNEIMVFKQKQLPNFGQVLVMQPTSSLDQPGLRGVNFFVDEKGDLQAYEYFDGEVLDMSEYATFLAEFCALVVERGLQNKLGLKTKTTWEVANWTEFEYPYQRSTIIIPQGMPVPDSKTGINVVTEWKSQDLAEGPTNQLNCFAHCNSHCSSHCQAHQSTDSAGEQWYLGGQRLLPGTSIHALVNEIVEAW